MIIEQVLADISHAIGLLEFSTEPYLVDIRIYLKGLYEAIKKYTNARNRI